MHQRLRSSFILKQEKQEWQRITSDTMYGTFFSIYAKFNYNESSSSIPLSCSIKIQNFQGAVTLGITSINSTIKLIYDKVINEYVYYIQIHLKALQASTEVNNSIIFEDFRHDYYKKDNSELGCLDNKKLLFVGVFYENLHDEIDLTTVDVNTLPFIDTARYLRDGNQLHKKELSSIFNQSNLIDHGGKCEFKEPVIPVGETNEITLSYLKARPCRDLYVRFINEK